MNSRPVRKKASKRAPRTGPPSADAKRADPAGLWLNLGALAAWGLTVVLLSGRTYFVMGYNAAGLDGRVLVELFLGRLSAWAVVLLLSCLWMAFALHSTMEGSRHAARAAWLLVASALPLGLALLRGWFPQSLPAPAYWETLWMAGFAGLAFGFRCGRWQHARSPDKLRSQNWLGQRGMLWLGAVCLLVGLWWTGQTLWYYEHFLLGFNDFGHFAQRLANTSAGRGLLLESPVLPPFWDHFNPGLLLFVPLWSALPDVQWIFVLQAGSLAISGYLVAMLAQAHRYSTGVAALWGLAWLVQPVLGQMNIAYTYGWHPITLAIPLLLAALVCLAQRRPWWAGLFALLAMSMEEGVVVIVACYALAAAWFAWRAEVARDDAPDRAAPTSACGFSSLVWAGWGLACAGLFMLIYQFSGIRPFQTGRFVALGDSALAVVLSPVLNPAAFWGELFQADKLWFVLSLALPCGLLSLLGGWRICLACIPPLTVLLVWDHTPATCLAFQYPSTLLPVLWLASIQGSRRVEACGLSPQGAAFSAVTTGLLLSLFVGGLPFSQGSTNDVVGITYGETSLEERGPDGRLGHWLREQIALVRSDGGAVLASGRVAAHLVGNADVETVSQYLERRPQLATLPDRQGQPLTAYQWILVDRGEHFQQSRDQIERVLLEAETSGFERDSAEGPLLLLRRITASPE